MSHACPQKDQKAAREGRTAVEFRLGEAVRESLEFGYHLRPRMQNWTLGPLANMLRKKIVLVSFFGVPRYGNRRNFFAHDHQN